MFEPQSRICCHGCDGRIFDNEERILEDGGVYHKFCHRRKERDKLLRALLRVRASGLGIHVISRRNPP